jgi:hypothetical protein
MLGIQFSITMTFKDLLPFSRTFPDRKWYFLKFSPFLGFLKGWKMYMTELQVHVPPSKPVYSKIMVRQYTFENWMTKLSVFFPIIMVGKTKHTKSCLAVKSGFVLKDIAWFSYFFQIQMRFGGKNFSCSGSSSIFSNLNCLFRIKNPTTLITTKKGLSCTSMHVPQMRSWFRQNLSYLRHYDWFRPNLSCLCPFKMFMSDLRLNTTCFANSSSDHK